ncbi:hypothetical protein [Pseudomonas fildesensis]|uniref:hypothetical protein n=1 Tax=Pseudomonas fildesensis TaxID=1674920 RepID=UPI000AF2AE63|nr:hypothetical protein [Pseudomonas fildesensis]
MPSPLPPTIATVKDSAGNNIANNGAVSGGSVSFTGAGLPGVTLDITVTTDGIKQTPSTASVLIGSDTKWSANLTSLPAGNTVVTFTESLSNPVVTSPGGIASWSFTVTLGVREDFTSLTGQVFEQNWRLITKNNISFYYNSKNTGCIRDAREFWPTTSSSFKGKLEGSVVCLNYYPKLVSDGTSLFSLGLCKSKDDNTIVNVSKVSFYYLSQAECTVYAKDGAGNILDQRTLAPNPTMPLQVTFSARNILVIVVLAPPIATAYSMSSQFTMGNLELTPST